MNKNKKWLSLFLALSLSLGLNSGCSKKDDVYREYKEGEHIIASVNQEWVFFDKGSGTYHLDAPLGYKVVDYDYDYTGGLRVFHDYVYENIVPVETNNKDSIGKPLDKNFKKEIPEDGVYAPGEHILVTISDKLTPFGKEALMNLEAPYGYEVVDYDYDKTFLIEFENIVYRNVLPVKVSNIDDFGEPILSKETTESRDYYDVNEHVVVDLKKDINFWLGKNDQFGLTAPAGYVITDYDYDKNDAIEFQTITYKNIVPVSKVNNGFGNPIESQEVRNDGYYEPFEHVIVNIERSVNFLSVGKSGTKELTSPEGYEILDYDYEYGEDYQFETYVYTNNEKVFAEDINEFGKVLKK